MITNHSLFWVSCCSSLLPIWFPSSFKTIFSYLFIVWLPKFFDWSMSYSNPTPNICDTQTQLPLRLQLLFKKKKKSKPRQQQPTHSCISNDSCKIVTTEKQKIVSKSVSSSTLFILLKEVITKQMCSHRLH